LTLADNPFDAAAGSYSRAGEHDIRRKVFRSARRHSLLVRTLRLVLPACGLLALAALFALSWVFAPGRIDNITVARTSITGNGIVMERPTLTGFDKDNRRYEVSARTAIQNITTPNQVRLNEISAEITLPDKGSATITAAGGDYDNKASTLKLIGPIKVDSTFGYRLSMKNADIDLDAGTLVSKNPVTIRYQDSEITGDSMSVSDGGKVIVLEGRVESNLMPPKRPAGNKKKDGAKAPQSINELIESAPQ
jgi:lipopolysaccharide export system protein LptC